ncbi:hypothetical protein [Pseudomonas sp. Xaverov 259]|uniref:hypothetical protein n=1 Tax=Pseudomonas sp. Xaverov 259 TaxID=2666086 RepID=UPI001C5A6038|nr:hypothetical protein [Pseudomonas sp. Xaverov 259]
MTTGTFNVTKSIHGAFTAPTLEFYESRATLTIGAWHPNLANKKVNIELAVKSILGQSNGAFKGDGKVPLSHFGIHKDGTSIFYSSATGSYEVTYDKAKQHVKGKAHFQSRELDEQGKPIEFAFDFDLTGFSS